MWIQPYKSWQLNTASCTQHWKIGQLWLGNTHILYHIHRFTHIHILTNSVVIYYFFYIRKIQDNDDWTLVAVLLMGNFYINFDKTRNMLLHINTSGEQDWQKYWISVQKTRDVKGWDEKVTNRRGRAIIQKIITPLSSSSPSGNPTLLLCCTITTVRMASCDSD